VEQAWSRFAARARPLQAVALRLESIDVDDREASVPLR
jgi:hypothetical protein